MTAQEMLKVYLGIPLTDSSKDDQLDLLIGRAQDIIDSFMGFSMKATDYTEKVEFARQVIPRFFPIVSVSSLAIHGEPQILSEYYVEKDSGIIYKMCPNSAFVLLGPGVADVVYRAGYEAPYPGWLNEAWAMTALFLDKYVYFAGGVGTGGGGSVGGGVSASAGGIASITVNDIYSISYHNNSLAGQLSQSATYNASNDGKVPDDMYSLIPPNVMAMLKMKRMRYYP